MRLTGTSVWTLSGSTQHCHATLLLVAAPTLLRSAYLAAMALRAIRGVDDLVATAVPRAIART
jgi:hypothetical protein